MTNPTVSTHVRAGDLVQLVSPSNKIYTFRISAEGRLHTHRGIIEHKELEGQPWGSPVHSHTGSVFYLLQPSLASLIQDIPRNTQIMYPKDIGFILVTMAIGPGSRVIEAGTGSGALTTALAWAVADHGRVYSYESRQEMLNLAIKNLTRLQLDNRVEFKPRDIAEGFDERDVDALFLDVPNPHDYLTQVRQALKPGGFFGAILPTVNQVAILLSALQICDFAFVDVCEILLRYLKPNPKRLRPTDRMVAHTGYLIFARPVLEQTGAQADPDSDELSA